MSDETKILPMDNDVIIDITFVPLFSMPKDIHSLIYVRIPFRLEEVDGMEFKGEARANRDRVRAVFEMVPGIARASASPFYSAQGLGSGISRISFAVLTDEYLAEQEKESREHAFEAGAVETLTKSDIGFGGDSFKARAAAALFKLEEGKLIGSDDVERGLEALEIELSTPTQFKLRVDSLGQMARKR